MKTHITYDTIHAVKSKNLGFIQVRIKGYIPSTGDKLEYDSLSELEIVERRQID